MWPSSVYGDRIMQRLADHKHPYEYRHLKYPYAGTPHPCSLLPDYIPGGEHHLGGNPEADAWPYIVEFLARSF